MNLYKLLIRPILFSIDPEIVHEASIQLLHFLQFILPTLKTETNKITKIANIDFPNKIGLAAGMDKACMALLAWQKLGFGFVEIGTITYHPQVGNPKPRLFRLSKEKSLINRLGFNGPGVEIIAQRLAKIRANKSLKIPIGTNIGKSRVIDSTNREAVIEDYLKSLNKIQADADYIAINISSPNTPGLRDWQSATQLKELLQPLKQNSIKPIFLKISPDLNQTSLLQILEVVENLQINGIIATNTTISRENCPSWATKEAGGLSGALLQKQSLSILEQLIKYKSKKTSVISVGGICSSDDIQRRLDLGADLVQIYTALIYEGPSFVYKVQNKLI